jgi:RNA polymerase sigma-70 factor (ECF subfamily)
MTPAGATLPMIPAMAEPARPLSATDDPDVALMVRVAAGDEAAFRQLVERHQHAVVGTIAKMLGDPVEAQDLAQLVFLRVWKSARRYQPTAKFTTWLFTVARNLVFNETRRRGRKREVSIEEREAAGVAHADASPAARPDQELLEGELRAEVDAAIAALPENQRLAVVLRRYENMPYEEIAAVLKTSVPSVKSLLFRARESLRQQLARYLDE